MHLGVTKGRDRTKITWKEGFSKDLKTLGIIVDLAKEKIAHNGVKRSI